ncbi:MAG: putative membrane protein [uncultured Sulfurovum sp.]|uniref:Putative membrane protein n=1 Tax=uncultured Sulfurovum sp. TaxID=269237 RepID=A0A6S6SJ55_9BACT|nr:MAG: putative membrane protein [uncultured Sulfurovum sp.]
MKFLLFILLSLNLYAHQSSLALMNMEVKEKNILGSYKLALKDAQVLVNLDSNFDGRVTWKEVKEQESSLANRIQTHLSVKNKDEVCSLSLNPVKLDELNSNTYLHFGFLAQCQEPIKRLDLSYSLLFNQDSLHKAYANIQANGLSHNILLTETQLKASVDLKETSLWSTFVEFVKQGIIHIFIGIDHILFLVALLLPSVLFLRQGRWAANTSFKTTLFNVLKIVTAFTVAHSITLTLTILGFISLPSWIIESFIAFSVVLAALNNFTGTIEKRLWMLVFAFGLIHGMGFASVLMDLELEKSVLALSLLGFNLGVELGQVAIVGLLVPMIYLFRNQKWYVPLLLYGGSLLIVLMGSLWLVERVSEGLGV